MILYLINGFVQFATMLGNHDKYHIISNKSYINCKKNTMKLIKVELTITRIGSLCSTIKKTVEVEKLETPTKTRRLAELNYCNDYINRDGNVAMFEKLTEAKNYAHLKITSEIIN